MFSGCNSEGSFPSTKWWWIKRSGKDIPTWEMKHLLEIIHGLPNDPVRYYKILLDHCEAQMNGYKFILLKSWLVSQSSRISKYLNGPRN